MLLSKPFLEQRVGPKLKQAGHHRFVFKFCTAHMLAKRHLSFNMFRTIFKLDRAKGWYLCVNNVNYKAAAELVASTAK